MIPAQRSDSKDDVHVTEPNASQIKMPSKDFQRICRELNGITPKVTLHVEPGMAQFLVEDNVIGQGAITIQSPEFSQDKFAYNCQIYADDVLRQ